MVDRNENQDSSWYVQKEDNAGCDRIQFDVMDGKIHPELWKLGVTLSINK